MSRQSIDATIPQERSLYAGLQIGIARRYAPVHGFAFDRGILWFFLAAVIWTVPIVALACTDTRALLVYLPNALLRGDALFLLGLGGSLVYLLASTWLLAAATNRLTPSRSRLLRSALQLAVAPAILASLITIVGLIFTLSFAMIARCFPALL